MNFHDSRKSLLTGPLYLQVSEIIRQRIIDAEWPVGQPIPNEADLSREVGVSKGTLRKALELLEDDHLIVRRQGRGTFVAQTSNDAELDRFSNLSCGGQKVREKAVSISEMPGPVTVDEARSLKLVPGSPVHCFNRLFRAQSKAVISEVLTLPKSRFLDLGENADLSAPLLFSVYRLDYDVAISSATEFISATSADAALARLMGVPEGTPLLRAERVAFTTHGTPVELSLRHIHLEGARYAVQL